MTLSNEYDRLYLEMLDELAAAPGRRWSRERLCGHWPCVGTAYHESRELLVVGRAVNGWEDVAFTLRDLATPSGRRAVVERAKRASAGLSWVTGDEVVPGGYNPNRSAFWMTLRDVLADMLPGARSPDWSEPIAWSNLYKVAPAETGNPSDSLCRAQVKGCRALFELEIQELSPRRVLLFTGGNWAADVLDGLGIEWLKKPGTGPHVEQVGRGLGAAWVVAKRPERKPRADVAAQVSRAFAMS